MEQGLFTLPDNLSSPRIFSSLSVVRVVQCCQVTRLHVFSSLLWYPLRFCVKRCSIRLDSCLFCKGFMFYLCYVYFKWYSCRLTVAWRVSHVEQELLAIPEHLSSTPVFSGIRVARSLVFYVMLCRSLFVLLAIVLSALVQLMASDYILIIFWLYLQRYPQAFLTAFES